MPSSPLSPLSRPPTRKMFQQENMQKWVSFPDSLRSMATGSPQGGKFTGYQTRYDETQNEGAFVVGQNVKMTQAQTPTLRNGTDLIGVSLGDTTPVQRAWVYETFNGNQFELKYFGTTLYYYLWGYSTDYALLLSRLTPNLEMGFANIGITTNVTSDCFFSNGVDGLFAFNGAFAQLASATSTTLTLQGTQTWAQLGFNYSPQSLGDSTTFWTVTNPTGTTMRFTYVSGTNPNLIVGFAPIGTIMSITGTGFNAANRGTFAATAFGINFFEVTNATVVPEVGKQGNTVPSITYDYNYNNNANFCKIIIGGVTATYTGGAQTKTLQGVSVDFSASPVGTLVVQQPINQDGTQNTDGTGNQQNLSAIQGTVMLAHDGRLHIRQETKKDIWNYSKLNNPFNFTVATPDVDGNAGSQRIEFSSGIQAFGNLNKTIIGLKNRLLKSLDFIQVGSRVDSQQYKTLVSVDDKGTSIGTTNQKGTFSTPFGLVFITPDKRMVLLTGVTANNEPQYFFLSDPIAQVLQQGVHDEGTGICVDNRIYYSFKQNSTSTFNDVEIQGNMLRQSFDAQGRAIPIFWDTPNVGLNCNDYTALYNATTKQYDVHRHSSLNSDTTTSIADSTDVTASFTGIVRTWAETFGSPDSQKRIDYVGIEIKMLESSTVTATVLFDQNGASGQTSFTLSGSDVNNRIESDVFNPFGASPYGTQMIGSNPTQNPMQRYIYWLELDPNVDFFSVSLQLSTNMANSNFELIRFSYRLVTFLEVNNQFKKNSN